MKWKHDKLGNITDIISGTTPNSGTQAYWGGQNVWITPTDLGKLTEVYITASERNLTDLGLESCSLIRIPKNSVVMSSRAPIGHLGIAGTDLFTNQGCKSFVCSPEINPLFLYYSLKHRLPSLQALGSGSTFAEVSKSLLESFEISFPDSIADQRQIAAALNAQLAEVEKARAATVCQLSEVQNLANAIIYESLNEGTTTNYSLADVLTEVKHGIGSSWASYPVYGATRAGLALAKEPPGKTPQRYKPVRPGTVFYNPMRILIGSIAFAEDDTAPGITSPDYVVLAGKTGLVDSRWFYYWLRSPLGEQCITSLARGAVRERMLFNRLAEGLINLPNFSTQQRASESLSNLKPMQSGLKRQLAELTSMPTRLLSAVFEDA